MRRDLLLLVLAVATGLCSACNQSEENANPDAGDTGIHIDADTDGSISGSVATWRMSSDPFGAQCTDREPEVAASVVALDADRNGASTLSDGQGHYSMSLPAGTYEVTVTTGTQASMTRTGVVVVAYEDVTVDFEFYDCGDANTDGSISGTVAFGTASIPGVTDCDEWSPVEGVEVVASNLDGDQEKAFSDGAGHYSLTLPGGAYGITATGDQFDVTLEPVVVKGGEDTIVDLIDCVSGSDSDAGCTDPGDASPGCGDPGADAGADAGTGGEWWHAFYGSAAEDHGNSLAVDGSGNLYVTGSSESSWNGPNGKSPLHAHSGGNDVFVLKVARAAPMSGTPSMDRAARTPRPRSSSMGAETST
jgi:hypothetical protein